VEYQREAADVSNQGDIAVMLRLPKDVGAFARETVTVNEVLSPAQGFWRPSRSANVLVLGDSFSNIYSLEMMGWGGSAGLVEQLSFLMRRPIDCILHNDRGAVAGREALSRELARGRDRLAGKKLVIWQFTDRELAFGDWRLLDLTLGRAPAVRFFVPARGSEVVATGTVAAVSAVPKPGKAPYRNHIMAVHLEDIPASVAGSGEDDAVVYLQSMRENVLTPAARLRPGDRVTLRLRPWSDVADKYDRINRSELADESLALQEPCWGEVVKP
jgi:alginate O-acetyltransferase complex protein AlgJ